MIDWTRFDKSQWPGCQRCPRVKRKFIPPDIVKGASLMTITEAPGETEAAQGRILVGTAGRIHNGLLREGGGHRTQVAGANVVACYTPGNPTPTTEEIECCAPVLEAAIEEVGPRVLLAAGKIAIDRLVGTGFSVAIWRGSILETPEKVTLGEKTVLGPDRYGPKAQKAGQLKPHKVPVEIPQTPGRIVVVAYHPAELAYTGFAAYPFAVADYARAIRLSRGPLIEVGGLLATQCNAAVMGQVFEKAKECVLDVETDGKWGRLTVIGLAPSKDTGFSFDPTGSPFDPHGIRDVLRKAMAEEDRILVGHNLDYDVRTLRHEGIPVKARLWDTMHAAHLARPDLTGGKPVTDEEDQQSSRAKQAAKGLETVASLLSGYHYWNWKEEFREGRETIHRYCLLDCCWTAAIRDEKKKELASTGMLRHFETVMMPTLPVLIQMEEEGIRADQGLMEELADKQAKVVERLSETWYRESGDINPLSPIQLQKYIYGTLGIPLIVRRRKKGVSTPTLDAEALETLFERYPNVPQLRTLRHLRHTRQILKNYYRPDKLVDGRFQLKINMSGTFTGRLSAGGEEGFPFHGIPRIGEKCPPGAEGCLCYRAREVFIPDEGDEEFVIADWSQLEYRLAALLSGETWLIEAFKDPTFDIHQDTADRFKIPRSTAKNCNFASINLVGADKLARMADTDIGTARGFIKTFQRERANLLRFQMELIAYANKFGWIATPFSRRGYFPPKKKSDGSWEVTASEVVAFPHQSCGGSMMTKAIKRAADAGLKLRLTVHDELGISARSRAERQILRDVMEEPYEELWGWGCPAEIGWGRSWAEAKKEGK